MTTAIDIIKPALENIEVISAENDIEASMTITALKVLNNLGIEWEFDYRLGFTPANSPGESVNIPRFSVSAFESELALRLAPKFGATVKPALAKLADDTIKALRRRTIRIGDVKFPDTLPIGSGNECPGLINEVFFPQNKRVNF